MRRPFATSVLALLRRAVFAVALAFAAFTAVGLTTAEAGVATPGLATPSAAALDIVAPTTALTETVRWVCGPFRCFWRPNWNNWYVPPYARGWGPPLRPNCFWRRGWGGGWVHVCP
jgi:hypothetical protein